jgi:hypothetical protein
MNNRNRKRRRIPAQRVRKYVEQNHRRKFINLKKKMPHRKKKIDITPTRLDQKRKSLCHHRPLKTLNMPNKERIVKAAWEKLPGKNLLELHPNLNGKPNTQNHKKPCHKRHHANSMISQMLVRI